MADEGAPQKLDPSSDIYPPPGLPTFFADGVLNFSNSREVVKFYFSRFDPSLQATGPNKLTPVCQAVMPLTGIVQTAAFFNAAIATLISQGTLTAEAWKEAQLAQGEVKFNG